MKPWMMVALSLSFVATDALATSIPNETAWANGTNWSYKTNIYGLTSAWVYTPKTYSPAAPGKRGVVFFLLGCGQVIHQAAQGGGWAKAAEAYGMYVVVPAPVAPAKPNPMATNIECFDYGSNGIKPSPASPDPAAIIGAAKAMIKDATLGIDSRQVYLTGFSAGAGLSLELACMAPDVFSGVAEVAGPGMGSNQNQAVMPPSITWQMIKQQCQGYLAASGKPDAIKDHTYIILSDDNSIDFIGGSGRDGDTFCPHAYHHMNEQAFSDLVGLKPAGTGVSLGISGTAGGVCGVPARAWSAKANVYADGQGRKRLLQIEVDTLGHAWPAGSFDEVTKVTPNLASIKAQGLINADCSFNMGNYFAVSSAANGVVGVLYINPFNAATTTIDFPMFSMKHFFQNNPRLGTAPPQLCGAITCSAGETCNSATGTCECTASSCPAGSNCTNKHCIPVGGKDNQPPQVTGFTATPAGSAGEGTTVTLKAHVTDNVGVMSASLIDGTTEIVKVNNTGPDFTFNWIAGGVGAHNLTVKGRDAAGNVGSSNVISFTVTQGNWTPPAPVKMQQVTSFGTNPGKLNFFLYVPSNMPPAAPLVVVMHGCQQSALQFETYSQWNELAEKYKFYVVWPEQIMHSNPNPADLDKTGNPYKCFNWGGYYGFGFERGQGENQSVIEMVNYVKNKPGYSVDPKRVFVTGLSAGAAAAVSMASIWPDVFSGVAPMAGIPYRCANQTHGVDAAPGMAVQNNAADCMGININTFQPRPAAAGDTCKPGFGTACMSVARQNTAQVWGDLVRKHAPPGFNGPWPRVLIWQGDADEYVDQQNADELVRQWTNVHGLDQTADNNGSKLKDGNAKHAYSEYRDTSGLVKVAKVMLPGMRHGIAVDPNGTGDDKGGKTGSWMAFAYDLGIYSSYYTAKWFGMLEPGSGGSATGTGSGIGSATGSGSGNPTTGTDTGTDTGTNTGTNTSGPKGTNSSGDLFGCQVAVTPASLPFELLGVLALGLFGMIARRRRRAS